MSTPNDAINSVSDADVAAVVPPPLARVPLDRDRIVAAAITFIDANGLTGLTMRRLGRELGMEAMSLYHHVPGKEELLDAVVDSLIDDMSSGSEILETPRDGWQDFLQRLAHGVRRIALKHPKAFPLVASRPREAPWLRPPLHSLNWVEAFLAGLIAEGFSDKAATAVYRTFTSFLLGHLLLEVSTHGADVGPLDVLDDRSGDAAALREQPTVWRLRALLSEDRAATEFEAALEELLDRLVLIRDEHVET